MVHVQLLGKVATLACLTTDPPFWLQPLAMLMGYVLLFAISHVTLSKTDHKDRPFRLVQKHISKPLAWGWFPWLLAAIYRGKKSCFQ